MKNSTKLLLIAIISHVLLISAIFYSTLYWWIGAFIWWQIISITGISSGYHRYFSHRAFKTGRWYKYYVQILGIFANAGPVLTWASTHKMHHKYFGTEKDPHCPQIKGYLIVYLNLWGYSVKIDRSTLKGLTDDKSVIFFYKYYFHLAALISILLFAISPQLLIFGFCAPVVLGFHGMGLINTYTHRTDETQNSWLANILTGGEGWHKNHHDYPGEWQIGREWYQFDPGARFISLIKV